MAYRRNLLVVTTSDGRYRNREAPQRDHVQHPGQGNEARDGSAPYYSCHRIPPADFIAKTFPANLTWCFRVGARSYSFTAVSGISTPTPSARSPAARSPTGTTGSRSWNATSLAMRSTKQASRSWAGTFSCFGSATLRRMARLRTAYGSFLDRQHSVAHPGQALRQWRSRLAAENDQRLGP